MNPTSVRPRDAFEVRKWQFYNNQTHEIFAPIYYWPDNIVKIALKRHKKNMDRVNFVNFLRYNGLPPHLIRMYLNYEDTYDQSAILQINALMNGNYRCRYFDMISGTYENVSNN